MSSKGSVISEYRQILSFLKKYLKDIGLTYSELANRLGVSEATLKRMFSGSFSQSNRVFEVCAELDISYLWLVEQAKLCSPEQVTLPEEHEVYFEAEPILLPLLLGLRDGLSAKQLQTELALSETEYYRSVRKLEASKLVGFTEGGRAICAFSGPLKIRDDSNLARLLFKYQNEAFFSQLQSRVKDDGVSLQVYTGSITEQSHRRIVDLFHEFGETVRTIANQDKRFAPEKLRRPVRWVLGMGEFRTSWKRFGDTRSTDSCSSER